MSLVASALCIAAGLLRSCKASLILDFLHPKLWRLLAGKTEMESVSLSALEG